MPHAQQHPSKAEPGVHVHANGDVKLRVAQARGANVPARGVIALSASLIDRLHAASRARRHEGGFR